MGSSASRDHSTRDGDGRLHVYLNDHFAGSAAAVQLARRRRDELGDSELGTHLRELLVEIEDDRGVLERVMACLGTRPSPVKQGVRSAPSS